MLLLLVWEELGEALLWPSSLTGEKERRDVLWLGRERSLCAAGHRLMRDGQSRGRRKSLSLKSLSAGHSHLGTVENTDQALPLAILEWKSQILYF